MKKSLRILIAAAMLGGVAAHRVGAYSVAYVTTAANFPNQSVTVNDSVVNITSIVCPGDTIQFTVTFGVKGGAAGTTFPKSVTFGASTHIKPIGADDAVVTGFPQTHEFTSSGSSFPDAGAITAPTTPGAYTVRIAATSGFGPPGQGGLGEGDGLNINFTVSGGCGQACQPEVTSISVDSFCVVLHQPNTIDLKAKLLDSNNTGISGQTLHFSVDGNPVGDAVTDASGVATILGYGVTGLSIGDHEVSVSYDGIPCPASPAYEPSVSQGNIGVTYLCFGYQQPINADGSSAFKGAVVPVKIKICDYFGAPVTDANAHVFFGLCSTYPTGTEAEPLASTSPDGGNTMRYDPAADQYIFNWDITTVANGTYQVWVDLDEGRCGQQHTAKLSIAKVGKGVKR